MNILQYRLNWLGNVMVVVLVSNTADCRFDTASRPCVILKSY